MPAPAIRFKSWTVQLCDGTMLSKENLPRGTGLLDVIHQVSQDLQSRHGDIARAELITNHGQARVHTGDEMRSLLISHTSKPRTMALKEQEQVLVASGRPTL